MCVVKLLNLEVIISRGRNLDRGSYQYHLLKKLLAQGGNLDEALIWSYRVRYVGNLLPTFAHFHLSC